MNVSAHIWVNDRKYNFSCFSVAMHNPYANHNPTAASVQNHVMGASSGVPDVHKRDKDAIYG